MNSNLTTRIVKIPANQAGPYSTGTHRVSVTIPRNRIIDMSKSFLEVEVNINTVDGDAGTGSGVYPVNLAYGQSRVNPAFNVSLIRNCRLSSEMLGAIEETQDVNHLRTNLNHLQLSRSEQQSLSYNSLNQSINRYGQRYSIFRQLNGEGSVASVPQLGRIPVKLSQLFGMGELQEVDTSITGDLNVEVELDINNLSAQFLNSQEEGFIAVTGGAGVSVLPITATYTARSFPLSVGQGVLVYHTNNTVRVGFRRITAIDFAGSTVTVDSALPGAITNLSLLPSEFFPCIDVNGGTSVTLEGTYETLNGLPFYVGQKIEVSAGNGGTVDVSTIVTTITRSDAGVVLLGITGDTGGNLTNVRIRPIIPTGSSATAVFENLQLVLHEKSNKTMDASGGYRIYSYQTERSNGNGNQIYNGSFNLPPQCINAILMNNISNDLYSTNVGVSDYRLVLDNNNLTDRPVAIYEPLYYDELSKWNVNGGTTLKNLSSVNQSENYNEKGQQAPGMNVVYVGTHCPITSSNKNLQVEINSTGAGANGINNVNVYKQLELVVGGK
jgi:hypothetical protein